MVTRSSTAGPDPAVMRPHAAQLIVAVRAACRLAELRRPDLFTSELRLNQVSGECDDLCMVTAHLLLARGAGAAFMHEGQISLCMLRCEECAREAERLGETCLVDLVRACREASRACRELVGLLEERRRPSVRGPGDGQQEVVERKV